MNPAPDCQREEPSSILFMPSFVRNVNENHEEICLVEEIFLALKTFKGRHLFKSCLTAWAYVTLWRFTSFAYSASMGALPFPLVLGRPNDPGAVFFLFASCVSVSSTNCSLCQKIKQFIKLKIVNNLKDFFHSKLHYLGR